MATTTAGRWEGPDLLLDVRVQPRATRDKLGDIVAGRLKVYITAPPVEGKANAYLRRFLGKQFGVPPSRIEILRGTTGRDKQLRIPSPKTLPPTLQALS